MKRYLKKKPIACILIIMPLLLSAQYRTDALSIPGLNVRSSSEPVTFFGLDLSQIEFQNSYSMQVSSNGGDAIAQGLLKSSFSYAINPQVTMRGYVGLMHTPFSSFRPPDENYSFMNNLNMDQILYGGEIIYRPTANTVFHFGFNRQPTQYQIYQYPNSLLDIEHR